MKNSKNDSIISKTEVQILWAESLIFTPPLAGGVGVTNGTDPWQVGW